MSYEIVVKEINNALQKWDISELEKIADNYKDDIKCSTELMLFYMVFNIEKDTTIRTDEGIIACSKNFDLAVSRIKTIKNLIVRADWAETGTDDVIKFSEEVGVPKVELLYFVQLWSKAQKQLYYSLYDVVVSDLYVMNDYKPNTFAFIICVNDKKELEEARWYVNRLRIPNNFGIEILEIEGAKSMCSGYNEGLDYANSLNAKYKIYMHQDIRILNRNLLFELLNIFKDPSIGMVGMVGPKEIPKDGIMWNKPQYGNIVESRIDKTLNYQEDGIIEKYQNNSCVEVSMVDGCFIATQYDVRWREDIFDGWDFYDASQSMEFKNRNYRIVIPYMERPWVYHDFGIPSMKDYSKYQKCFISEYFSKL